MAEYYDREKLYQEVWESPMTEVCKRYNVSDVALAKICKKLQIPRPPVGYWAKKEAGKAPKKPKLYKFEYAPQLRIKEPIETKPMLAPEAFEDAEKLIVKVVKIIVPKEETDFHPFVRNTRKVFKRNQKKSYYRMYNRFSTSGEDVFEINIGSESLDRVSIILQAICETAAFYELQLVKSEKYGVSLIILDEEITFRITESTKKTQISKEEQDPKKYNANDYDYIPTGILKLEIYTDSFSMDDRKAWTDTKTKSIEEKLLDIIHQFIRASAWKKEYLAQKIKREEEWQIERERRTERERLIKMDKKRVSNLVDGFKVWLYHKDMTEYVTAVKSHYIANKGEPEGDFALWLEWAETYLEKTNPMNGEYPKFAT